MMILDDDEDCMNAFTNKLLEMRDNDKHDKSTEHSAEESKIYSDISEIAPV